RAVGTAVGAPAEGGEAEEGEEREGEGGAERPRRERRRSLAGAAPAGLADEAEGGGRAGAGGLGREHGGRAGGLDRERAGLERAVGARLGVVVAPRQGRDLEGAAAARGEGVREPADARERRLAPVDHPVLLRREHV